MSRRRIAIIGSRGRLGAALVRAWSDRHDVTSLARPTVDLAKGSTLDAALRKGGYDLVINCAAFTNVDACESDPGEAEAVNTDAPARIASLCAAKDMRFIHVSTDYVFDGRRTIPYTEDVPVSPVSVYGNTKAAGERAVQQADPKALIVRVSWVFGPDRASFVDMILARARGDNTVAAIADKWSTPTYTEDLAVWIEALFESDPPAGIYHLCNAGECTWQEYAEHALRCAADIGASLKTTTVRPQKLSDLAAFVAERPIYTVLDTSKFTNTTGIKPAPWQDAVGRYVRSMT
ncbi:MAG: dTDP-4-dehydrorhamnose reductase [Chthoniobacterales bacterium]